MVELITERLRIIPLDLEGFRLFIEDFNALEKRLGVSPTGKGLDDELRGVFREPYLKALEDQENYLWYTNWQIVLKEENRIIGGLTFKGLPNQQGEVEVGYGLEEEYRRRGYMGEALTRVIQWALTQEHVNSVVAETEKGNLPSQRVLERVGMEKYQETTRCYWYRLDKAN